jgi:hypothetical protein
MERMEHLWSRAGATTGNRSQMPWLRKRLKQAGPVATGCDQLPIGAHGKEGVDGSSSSEGSAKAPQIGAFSLFRITLHKNQCAVGMEPFMELSGLEARSSRRRGRYRTPSNDSVQLDVGRETAYPGPRLPKALGAADGPRSPHCMLREGVDRKQRHEPEPTSASGLS